MCYPCCENKGADQLRGYAKLICAFVFAYAKSRFSHDAAHFIYMATRLGLCPTWLKTAKTIFLAMSLIQYASLEKIYGIKEIHSRKVKPVVQVGFGISIKEKRKSVLVAVQLNICCVRTKFIEFVP